VRRPIKVAARLAREDRRDSPVAGAGEDQRRAVGRCRYQPL